MKYIGIGLITLFLIVAVKSKEEIDEKNKELNQIKKDLENLHSKYDEDFYLACFSVYEIRPYSILQFEQNVDIYTGEWITSKNYLSNLNAKEKELLKNKIAEYLLTEKAIEKSDIIEKINSWCINHKQFEFIIENYRITEKDFVGLLEKFEEFSNITNLVSNQGPEKIDKSNILQIDEAITNAENIISDMPLKTQLIIYSSIYRELSIIASNE